MLKDRRHGKLFTFVHYQRLMGLAYIDYSSVLRCYVFNPTLFFYILQILVLFILSYCLYGALTLACVDKFDMESHPGRNFYQLVLLTCPITQFMVMFWFYLQQEKQMNLLQKLSNLAFCLKVDTTVLTRPCWFYRIWLGTTFYYNVNLITGIINLWEYCPHFLEIINFLAFNINIVRNNFIITCYASFVSAIVSMLQEQASQLIQSGSSISSITLAKNIRIHNELLLMCMEELMDVFGVILLLDIFYIGNNAVYVAYLFTLDSQFSSKAMVNMLCWMIVLCIYMVIPLMNNALITEVSLIYQSNYLFNLK